MKQSTIGASSRLVFRSVLGSTLLAVGVACATNSIDSADGNTGKTVVSIPGYSQAEPLTIEQYCEARVALQTPWCAYYSRCCLDKEHELYSLLEACDSDIATKETCVAYYTTFQTTTGAVYAGAYAQAALSELRAFIPTAPSACSGTHYGDQLKLYDARRDIRSDGFRALFQGKTADGVKCDYSTSCLFGSTCQTLGGSAICTKRSSASCLTNDDCVGGRACIDSRCRPPPGDGDSCTSRSDCVFGSVCATNGSCSSRLGSSGDSCKYSDACRQGLGCSFASSTCVALKTAGTTCSIDGECAGRCKTGKCADRCGGSGSY